MQKRGLEASSVGFNKTVVVNVNVNVKLGVGMDRIKTSAE